MGGSSHAGRVRDVCRGRVGGECEGEQHPEGPAYVCPRSRDSCCAEARHSPCDISGLMCQDDASVVSVHMSVCAHMCLRNSHMHLWCAELFGEEMKT